CAPIDLAVSGGPPPSGPSVRPGVIECPRRLSPKTSPPTGPDGPPPPSDGGQPKADSAGTTTPNGATASSTTSPNSPKRAATPTPANASNPAPPQTSPSAAFSPPELPARGSLSAGGDSRPHA